MKKDARYFVVCHAKLGASLAKEANSNWRNKHAVLVVPLGSNTLDEALLCSRASVKAVNQAPTLQAGRLATWTAIFGCQRTGAPGLGFPKIVETIWTLLSPTHPTRNTPQGDLRDREDLSMKKLLSDTQEQLKATLENLKAEQRVTARLRNDIQRLENENATLRRAENEAGRGRGRGTDVKTVSTLKKNIETLQTTIEELRETITEQEARLKKRQQPASPPAPEPKRAKTTTADNSTNDMSAAASTSSAAPSSDLANFLIRKEAFASLTSIGTAAASNGGKLDESVVGLAKEFMGRLFNSRPSI